MINNVVLAGRLTKDPEIRFTASGNAVCNFTLAVNRNFKSEGQPEADFINCVIWNKSAEVLANNVHKGNLIGVEGSIQTRTWENEEGKRNYVTEVYANSFHFLESKRQEEQPPQQEQRNNNNNRSNQRNNQGYNRR